MKWKLIQPIWKAFQKSKNGVFFFWNIFSRSRQFDTLLTNLWLNKSFQYKDKSKKEKCFWKYLSDAEFNENSIMSHLQYTKMWSEICTVFIKLHITCLPDLACTWCDDVTGQSHRFGAILVIKEHKSIDESESQTFHIIVTHLAIMHQLIPAVTSPATSGISGAFFSITLSGDRTLFYPWVYDGSVILTLSFQYCHFVSSYVHYQRQKIVVILCLRGT